MRTITWNFRHAGNQTHTPIHISGAAVEHVPRFKFLKFTSLRTLPGPWTPPGQGGLVKKEQLCLIFWKRPIPALHYFGKLFPLYYWLHLHKLHLSLVWQLHCNRPKNPFSRWSKCKKCPTNHWYLATHCWQHLQETLSAECKSYHQRHLSL